jgi:RIO-like serine/threonine protein kinase
MNSGLNHKLIKEFVGHSGSKVYLKECPSGGIYVEKVGNTERNLERLSVLATEGYPVPNIILHEKDHMIMEYIHGLDMKNYLIHNNIYQLLNFIFQTLDKFSENSIQKDYTETYYKKLSWMNDTDFPFTKKELISW